MDLFANILKIIPKLLLWGPPMILAVILHEIAHGAVANRLGDDTAKRSGRLTLNPISHVDPIGTIALPLFLLVINAPFLFGYAKPVPVNFRNLRNPKRDMVWVALAGPGTNFVLAGLSAALLHLVFFPAATALHSSWLLAPVAMLQASVVFNVVLGVFNLLPILPLDGGRVLTGLLPLQQAIAFSRLEPYGMLIVMMLLATNALGQVIGPVVHAFLSVLL